MVTATVADEKIIILLFPRTPLSSLSMSAWYLNLIAEQKETEFDIVLALPNIKKALLNTILLPWRGVNYKSIQFNYENLKYFPGALGVSSNLNLIQQRRNRVFELNNITSELNSSLKEFYLSLSKINIFCFTSEHPILLHNILSHDQKIFYFEHGFGDYAIYLSYRKFYYRQFALIRDFFERILLSNTRSNFYYYIFISIFGSKNDTPIFNEQFINHSILYALVNDIKDEVLKSIEISRVELNLDLQYFLVSLDQIEHFEFQDLQKFLLLIYKDFKFRSYHFRGEEQLLIKPREDISELKLLELRTIVNSIDPIRIKIFLGTPNLHTSSEMLCISLNIDFVYTHGYSLPAFLNCLGLNITFFNLNPYYRNIYGLNLYFNKRLNHLKSFRRHHKLINRELSKYREFGHLASVGIWVNG